MKNLHRLTLCFVFTVAALDLGMATPSSTGCPPSGWQESLYYYLYSQAEFPTRNTAGTNVNDCDFHQWSWEAFVWATAIGDHGLPRFLTLPTPDDLLSAGTVPGNLYPRPLKLAARSLVAVGLPGYTEGAGAFVEADGNVLIAPNGYPVYASVHMNPAYFLTARKNLIATGGYTNQPPDSFFPVGAAVFKATWLRLDPRELPPTGAFVTEAQVPILTVQQSKTTLSIVPVPGQFQTVRVALVGLHVVGQTVNHPEFLWGTFEHKLNCPSVPDNTFTTNGVDGKNYTFYTANTPYSEVDQPNVPPALTFDPATQRFYPPNNVVLQNQTGGEDLTDGPENVASLNQAGQSFLSKLSYPQSEFANYNLIGTVWMAPNSYTTNSSQTNAVGSVALANSTAETFVQTPTPQPPSLNCFLCHNATSYSFQDSPPPLINRRIALSHVLGVGTPYAVPNLISGSIACPEVHYGEVELRQLHH